MKGFVLRHQPGKHIGICPKCSADPLVIEVALRFDPISQRQVLIEAALIQPNPYADDIGMIAADFHGFVNHIAGELGFPCQDILPGGDHLGSGCWQNGCEPAVRIAK